MRRHITGFVRDDAGQWVAELSCLHRQHVRHDLPFQDRQWVLDDAERTARVGTDIECPLCDRAELPDGLRLTRTAGPFDEASLPAGLRRTHTVAAGRWGVLRVRHGRADLAIAVIPPLDRHLQPGDVQPIPPEVPHLLTLRTGAVVEIDFLVPSGEVAALEGD